MTARKLLGSLIRNRFTNISGRMVSASAKIETKTTDQRWKAMAEIAETTRISQIARVTAGFGTCAMAGTLPPQGSGFKDRRLHEQRAIPILAR